MDFCINLSLVDAVELLAALHPAQPARGTEKFYLEACREILIILFFM